MRRREFLRHLATTTGCLAWSLSPLTRTLSHQEQSSKPLPPVVPIRGLIEKNGRFFQPIRLSPQGGPTNFPIVVRIDGTEVGHQPGTADVPFDVLAPAVDAPHSANVEVETGGRTESYAVLLKPVRKVTVYVLPHSHNDIGYTDLQAAVEAKQIRNLQLAIDLARRTAGYPEGARFVWNLEGLWAVDMFMRRATAEQKSDFFAAVKSGWLALNGMYANELTGLCRPEELLQLFRYATKLGPECGAQIDSAMISDVPGFTWGTATAMSQAGIRYFSAAPNFFDRIGSLMEVWQDKPFWWISPSGKEKILVWIPWTGYAMSHLLEKADETWVSNYQDRLDSTSFPYDISYIRWSGHGDNAEPDPQICEFFKDWNTNYAWPKFVISSTSAAFRALENRHGPQLPQFKGDLTPYWEDGAASSAFETAVNRDTAERLVQAEALFAMRSSTASSIHDAVYPSDAFFAAWRNVLLYSEHTWGAWNSVSDSENPFVTQQWETKRAFATEAARQSRDLLDRALRRPAARTSAADSFESHPRAFDVYNTTSWRRSELVILQPIPPSFAPVTDVDARPLSSQRLSDTELAVWITDVPPLTGKRIYLAPSSSYPPAHAVTIDHTTLDNGLVRVNVDPLTGNIDELIGHSDASHNFAVANSSEQINQYLFLAGADLADLQTSGPPKITVETSGPLVATLRIESDAPGCNSLVRRVRLCAGADYVEITNIVDKKRAPMNPTPGKGNWAQTGGKESVQFAFPFDVPAGQIRLDVPLAVMRPEIDQLPGSCKNWLPVGRWIDVSNESRGVTCATLDAPLVEIGEISARMLGSQTRPDIWRKRIGPTQKFYSWVMNNHWGTNYRAYQEGVVTFRYALRPHGAFDAASAARFATGLTQPLIAVPAEESSPLPQSFHLLVEPAEVLVTTFKPSDDGRARIVRLFGASGQDCEAKIIWPYAQPESLWLSDTSEKRLSRITGPIAVPAWGLVTLRAEVHAHQ